MESKLPSDIQSYLDETPPLTKEMLDELAESNERINNDPHVEADLIKMQFVNEMLAALDERGETKAHLAERLGKSRQYIQKVFDDSNRANFTVDTLCLIAHALGRKFHPVFCKADEELAIYVKETSNTTSSALDAGCSISNIISYSFDWKPETSTINNNNGIRYPNGRTSVA